MSSLNRFEASPCEKQQNARQRLRSDKRARRFKDILDNIGRVERFTAGFDLAGLLLTSRRVSQCCTLF